MKTDKECTVKAGGVTLVGDEFFWNPKPWPKHECLGCGAEIDRSVFIKNVKFRICCDCLYKAVESYIDKQERVK